MANRVPHSYGDLMDQPHFTYALSETAGDVSS